MTIEAKLGGVYEKNDHLNYKLPRKNPSKTHISNWGSKKTAAMTRGGGL